MVGEDAGAEDEVDKDGLRGEKVRGGLKALSPQIMENPIDTQA